MSVGRLVDLTTYRRSGDGVVTPVRAARDGDRVVVSLLATSGKVARARRDSRVAVDGRAGRLTFLDGDDAARAYARMRRRHPLLHVQRLVFGRDPYGHVMAEVELDDAG